MAAVLRVVCDADVKMVDVRQLVGVGTFVGHRQRHVLEVDDEVALFPFFC